MTLAPLLTASPAIQLHAFAAMAAFALGLLQFAAPKGTMPHRTVGLDLGRADDDRRRHRILRPRDQAVGTVEPIHLLAIFTLVMLPFAVLHARGTARRTTGGR